MAVKFEFWLSDDDFDRLYEIKRKNGDSDVPGNEFAKKLLEREIHRLHPQRVKHDDGE